MKNEKLTSNQLMQRCEKSDWDWVKCCEAINSGELSSAQCLKLCKKTEWDWDVCNACLRMGIFGVRELTQMLKNKQNPNVVYALKLLGKSYSDIEKNMNNTLKRMVSGSTIFLTSEQIREKIALTGLYDTSSKNYFIAYKGVQKNRQSRRAYYLPRYNYQDGFEYNAFANCDPFEKNSYGLSVWTEDAARDYEYGAVLKVRIPYYAVAAIVHDNKKIRVRNLHVMHAVGAEKEYADKMAAKKSEIRENIAFFKSMRERTL